MRDVRCRLPGRGENGQETLRSQHCDVSAMWPHFFSRATRRRQGSDRAGVEGAVGLQRPGEFGSFFQKLRKPFKVFALDLHCQKTALPQTLVGAF